ncbi:MAG: O-Antigen ligase [Gaiellaceae bacterium]|nr:O-Antigen ligase [Gaiellaceae bacterium]
MTSAAAHLGRRSDLRLGPVAWIAAAISLEVGLGLLAGGNAVPATLVLGAAAVAIIGLLCILAPRQALFVLAGLWGATHTIMADFTLGHVGALEVTLSRGLGLIVLFALGFVAVAPRLHGPSGRLPGSLVALSLFALLFLAGAFAAPSTSDALSDFVRVASAVVIGVLAYRMIDTEDRLLRLARLVAIGGVVVAGVTIVQFALIRVDRGLAESIFGSSFYQRSFTLSSDQYAVRVNGPLGGPGETANFLVVAAAFALLRYTLLRERGRSRATLIALLTISAGVLATLTRTALIALVCLFFVWAIQRQVRRGSAAATRLKVFTATCLVALVAVPLVGVQNITARLGDAAPSAGTNFAQGRGGIWAAEVDKFSSGSPLQIVMGHGPHSSYVPIASHGVVNAESPHNLFLWLLVETGLAGLLVYALFLGGVAATFLRALKKRRYEFAGQTASVAISALVAYFVLDMFVLTVNSPGNRWYFMLLVGATLRAVTRPRADGVEGAAA